MGLVLLSRCMCVSFYTSSSGVLLFLVSLSSILSFNLANSSSVIESLPLDRHTARARSCIFKLCFIQRARDLRGKWIDVLKSVLHLISSQQVIQRGERAVSHARSVVSLRLMMVSFSLSSPSVTGRGFTSDAATKSSIPRGFGLHLGEVLTENKHTSSSVCIEPFLQNEV